MTHLIPRMLRTALLAGTALLTPALGVHAARPTVLDVTTSITDNAIIFPESFEQNTQKLLEGWYMRNYTATDDRYRTMPDVPVSDEVVMRRLQAIPAIVELPFNQIVRAYIDRYTQKSRPQVAAILGLNNYYLPIFEQALEQEGLPLELKYLPMIESGLDPNAVSRHGATGLWQFMLAAAKGFDMEVNSLVDERRDPYISSQRAARFLKQLHATYGDWSLAIAAYNCGPGTVNKAIRRAGGDPKSHNFWSIYNYLPAETRGYVPLFIAANYVMNYHGDHNISPVLATKPLVTDTVAVNRRIHFEQISNVLNIPVEELRVLNPQFRADIIPGSPQKPYYLILPSQQIHAYIMSEQAIADYDAQRYARQTTAEPGRAGEASQPVAAADTAVDYDYQLAEAAPATPTRTVTHKVAPQETLASIAAHYGVSPQQIKDWNSLRRNSVRVGTELRIQVPEGYVAQATPATASQGAAAPAQTASQPTAQARTRQQQPAQQQPAAQQPTAQRQSAQQPAQQQPDRQSTRAPRRNAGAQASQQQQTAQQPARTPKKDSKKKPKKDKKPQTVTHTVAQGESVERVARRYGVSVDDVKRANNLTGANPVLQPNQRLTIPSKTQPQASSSRRGAKTQAAQTPAPSKKKKKRR